jgi:hypothetical protein
MIVPLQTIINKRNKKGGYQLFRKCLKLPLHFTPRSRSSWICSTGLLTMYWRSSMGRRGGSPSCGNGNRFWATSIKESASDQTSDVTVYGSPRIRSGYS